MVQGTASQKAKSPVHLAAAFQANAHPAGLFSRRHAILGEARGECAAGRFSSQSLRDIRVRGACIPFAFLLQPEGKWWFFSIGRLLGQLGHEEA